METTTKKKRKSSAETKTFIRSFKYEGSGHTVSGVSQPYCVGMYIAITDSRSPQLIQLNIPHTNIMKWYKRVFAKMEKDGMVGSSYETEYINYLSKEDIQNYIL